MNTIGIIYLASIIFNRATTFAYKMKIINYLADNGYKLKDYYGFTRVKTIDFVLGLNVLKSLKKLVKPDYETVIQSDDVEKMNGEELYEYSLDHDLMTAFCINSNCFKKSEEELIALSKVKELTVNNENKIVYYKNSADSIDKYVIISVSGSLLVDLPYDEQERIVSEYYDYVDACLKEVTDKSYEGDSAKLDEAVFGGEFDYLEYIKEIEKIYGGNVEQRLKR